MLFFKQDASISQYSRKIIEASKRQMVDTILPKGQSKSILINDCPFCKNYITCAGMVKDYLKQGQIRMPCLIRSTDTNMIWLSIRDDDRRSVKVGDRYGKLVVIIPQKPDEHGNRRWLCKCDCGKAKIIRGDHLLDGGTVSCGCSRGGDHISEKYQSGGAHSNISEEEKKEFVPVEAKVNSQLVVGALPSRPSVGNESKTGKSISITLLADHEGESSPFEVTGLCNECFNKIRFDDRGYKVCENCGAEAAPVPDVSGLSNDLKFLDLNEKYSHLDPQESFGQPLDDDLKRLMLLKEIDVSDYIDRHNGEWGSAQQTREVFIPPTRREPDYIQYADLCSNKTCPQIHEAESKQVAPPSDHDYVAEFKQWCDDILTASIRNYRPS